MGGGTMCGVVFGNQPSVGPKHMLRICTAYVSSFDVTSVMFILALVSIYGSYPKHTLNICSYQPRSYKHLYSGDGRRSEVSERGYA